MRRTPLIFVTLGAGIIAACSPDRSTPTEPRALPTRPAFDGEGCGTQIICDDGSINWFDDGYEETSSLEEDGSASVVLTGSTGSYGQAPFCPGAFGGMWTHTINVPTPQGTRVMKPFSFQGLHTLLFENPPGLGRYSLPAGYWPAVDGSGVQAQAESADATCVWTFPAPGTLRIDIGFYRYHRVNTRWPRRRGVSNGSGGGGAPPGCHYEYIYLEVNYGDGTGWHVIWEGNALVCG
jgi:hypothetical protein